MKRSLNSLTVISAIACVVAIVLLLVSHYMTLADPSSSGLAAYNPVPIGYGYRLGADGGEIWLYNKDIPNVSITLGISDTNNPPRVIHNWYLGEYGASEVAWTDRTGQWREYDCDLPGICYRDFSGNRFAPNWTTLVLSLWYPIAFFAILPAVWFIRRAMPRKQKR